MFELTIDEELRKLIPPLDSEERRLLEESILRDGCRHPLIVWEKDGQRILIDGHNRYDICRTHGAEFDIEIQPFEDRTQVILWMIENQMGRRNLADIDRINLARRKEDIVRLKAKANQLEGQKAGGLTAGNGREKTESSLLAKLPESNSVNTRKEVAKAAGVGERTYDAGKLILEAAEKGEITEDEVEAIRRKEKSIHRVAKDIKENRKKQQRTQQREEAKAKAVVHDQVLVGDFRDKADMIPDGSLSLIFTDPPYDREASKLYADLADFAERKLCDGGSLITYIGHIQMADAMNSLSNRLRYWWPICCLHADDKALMTEYGIRVGWKPALWFVKGTRDDKSMIVSDVMSGGKDKSHHDWQQSQVEAGYWISKLCPEDGIVCDPFLGGGTTAAAAIGLARSWIGIEKDESQAALAVQRITEAEQL